MELFEAISKRASVRKLKPVEVPEGDLERILDAGRRAPSGRNTQPVDFIVIRDSETIQGLSKAQSCIADVSLVIALVADPEKSEFWLEDGSAAVENILIASTALGYGSCWLQGDTEPREEELKEHLGIPDDKKLLTLVPIGVPSEWPTREKKPLSEVLHWERYRERNTH